MVIQKKKTPVRDTLRASGKKTDAQRIAELESKVKELTEKLKIKEA